MLEASPSSFRSRYRVATAEHLGRLPAAVTVVTSLTSVACFHGRFRRDFGAPWMNFTSEQHNFIDPSARMFFMEASMMGLPVDGLHVSTAGTRACRSAWPRSSTWSTAAAPR